MRVIQQSAICVSICSLLLLGALLSTGLHALNSQKAQVNGAPRCLNVSYARVQVTGRTVGTQSSTKGPVLSSFYIFSVFVLYGVSAARHVRSKETKAGVYGCW